MRVPTKKELGPVLAGAGIFVFSTYATIHSFVWPRSEAEAAMTALNKNIETVNRRIDNVETVQANDRREYLEGIKEIRGYIIHKR